MADPLAPTVPDTPRDEPARDEPARDEPTPITAAGHMVRAAPVADPLERAVAKAKAAAALFGEAAAVKVGRYRLIERAGAGGMGVVWSAWDPELNRGVALKLASAGDEVARARARDEGRALARLSHPNVVPIYDVFEAPEGVFLVMELVKGKTLRTIAADGATVAELVRAYRQCGDGLAAAHGAGLVHRDFKPDNAILGADGRVRVLDFGLAHATDDTGAPLIAGTPRYMAPEQKRGEALTAAVDQFALCTSLREAVAARGAVPRWLEVIVTRGSAERAADRFESMAGLVAALALDPATRWRRRGLIGAGVITVGAVAVALVASRSAARPAPCQGGAASLASAWGAARRTSARTHLASLGGGYARESVPRILDAIDRYAGDWVTIQHAACMAHQRGEVSTAAFDRRTACLARRKAALAAVAEVADTALDASLPDLVIAASGLPALDVCEDDDALLSPVAPPPAADAPEAAAIADLIARVDVERDAARTDEASRDVDAALARARALAYPPLIARALLARGRIALTLARDDRGAADFAEVTSLALEVGDEVLAVEAFARGAFAIATTKDPISATAGLPLIEAITRRLGAAAAFPRALLHHNVGAVELARGDRDAAVASFEAARREAQGLRGAPALELTVVLESLMVVTASQPEREEIGKSLVDALTRALGPSHPRTLESRVVLGTLRSDVAAARAAVDQPCTVLADLHPSHRKRIVECSYDLMWWAAVAGDAAAATTAATRVRQLGGPDDRRTKLAAIYLAALADDTATATAQLAALEQPPPDAPWWRQLTSVDVHLAAALVAQQRHDDRAATAALDAAAALVTSFQDQAPVLFGQRAAAIAALRAR